MSKVATGPPAIDSRNMTASLPVSGDTPARKLAGALWKYSQEGYAVDMRAMGAGAVNQAVKAAVIARMMASGHGKDVYLVPTFQDEQVNGLTRTLVRFFIVVRSLSSTLPRPEVVRDDEA
jgi:stage V sporulation protein S